MNQNTEAKLQASILTIAKDYHNGNVHEAITAAINLTKNILDESCTGNNSTMFVAALAANTILTELYRSFDSLSDEVEKKHFYIQELETQLSHCHCQKRSNKRNGN
ncbi:hypothetical protein [Escherichia coli]|uniref:hypothetical protein n=1 Tax=Escherichia coli TaxID=562 RepID=UPI000CFB32D1|nr:hypothetical protein [Escherichia coli]